jgi:hypothetical protein
MKRVTIAFTWISIVILAAPREIDMQRELAMLAPI